MPATLARRKDTGASTAISGAIFREGRRPFSIDFPRLDRDMAGTEQTLLWPRQGTGAEKRPCWRNIFVEVPNGPERTGVVWSGLEHT